MSRLAGAGSETPSGIHGVASEAPLGRRDVGLIVALSVAWIACTVLKLTDVLCAGFPVGALTLVLIRTAWVTGTVWAGGAILRRGGLR